MSESAEQRGLDALTDEEWAVVDAMADEYDDQLGADLRAIHDGYHGQEAGDE